jgi:predicted porin
MNKKLIALSVAAALVAPSAMAEIVLYGQAHLDVRATDNKSTIKNVTVNNNSSYWGVRGSEILDNGLSVIYQYEMGYDVDGDNSISTPIESARNAYLGLSGGFGRVLVGRHDTPAQMAFYAAGNDHLDGSVIDLNDVGFTENTFNNTIAYVSPEMSGVQLAVAAIPGEQNGTTTATNENTLMDSYSVGLMYDRYGLKAGIGYEQVADTTASNVDNDIETLQAGLSYTFEGITLGGQYSQDENCGALGDNSCSKNTDGAKRISMAVAGKY